MGLDQQKTFLKHNSALIPADESVMGVVIAEPKGGAWRRGMRLPNEAAWLERASTAVATTRE